MTASGRVSERDRVRTITREVIDGAEKQKEHREVNEREMVENK
jgi:hypothetical protein